MASEAQIQANRRNTQKSTGPRTGAGKARARLNALKDGLAAKIPIPLLCREDPDRVGDRIQLWFDQLHPKNDLECELITLAASSCVALERAERYETAILASRIR